MKQYQRNKKLYAHIKSINTFELINTPNDALLSILKNYLNALDSQLTNNFVKGSNIRRLILARALSVDDLLKALWLKFKLDKNAVLIAVGGYGRKELHPQSDIDLLILYKTSLNKEHYENIERLISLLWDCGLKVSQAVREIEQCVLLAKKDVTVTTNIMESRFLCGDKHLFNRLKQRTTPDKIWAAKNFFKAKTDEQKKRYRKFDGTSFDLEPNLKSGPGGLRDIQLIGWVAQRTFYPKTLRQLIRQSIITKKEYYILTKCQLYIWQIRYALHIVSQKPEDRLLFDYQKQVALLMGYKDCSKSLAVEKMMKRYYRCALIIRNIAELLLPLIEEKLFTDKQTNTIIPINKHFQIINNRINAIDKQLFIKDPSQLLRIFQYVARDTALKGITTSTLRAIRAARYKITSTFRKNEYNKQLFVDFWHILHRSSHAISLMKRSGVLADYLVPFRQITGQMQYDMFHSYTVDEHTLFLLKNLCDFANPKLNDAFPLCSEIMQRQTHPEIIFIAGLFHDIAKGRGGDHSELGALEARTFCQNHHIKTKHSQQIEWLVSNHLSMSITAQKRDISDPNVIKKFAELVKTQKNLELLYILTVADIRATNHNLWNSWKDSLLKNLYLGTTAYFSKASTPSANLSEKKRNIAKQQLIKKGIEQNKIDNLLKNLSKQYFDKRTVGTIVWQMENILTCVSLSPIVVRIQSAQQKSGSEIFIYCKDKKNLFAVLTATLNQNGLSIQVANIYTDKAGYCYDSFYVLDENESALKSSAIKNKIQNKLRYSLLNPDKVKLNVQKIMPRKIKYFSIPTTINFYKDEFTHLTRMELTTRDRPGVLASIGKAFIQANVKLHDARVTTFGEKVEDTFIISQLNGSPITDEKAQMNIRKAIKHQLES